CAGDLYVSSLLLDAAVFGGNVVDEFLNDDGFSHSRAAEQTNLATFQIRLDEIDNLDAGFKHFKGRILVNQRWCGFMNGVAAFGFNGSEFVDRLADDIDH